MSDYKSAFAPYLENLVQLKRNLGYKYRTGASRLLQIDKFAVLQDVVEPVVTKCFAHEWCKQRPNETNSNRYLRAQALYQLSNYLTGIGKTSYKPIMTKWSSTFVPYIFTHDEIKAVFAACDQLRARNANKQSSINIIPALFRLLYGTGMRISEALSLFNKDVHLDEKYIVIRISKNGRERMLPLSDSVTEVCKTYAKYRDRQPIKNGPDDFFFRSLNGNEVNYGAADTWFRQILRIAGIPYLGRGIGPRVHDLRYPNKNIILTF
ncbi:MAG: tyrosine-type recombinase/integrase [Chitinophagaceae bacterium]|nr:tyrosine-type recombinase/integrase [Chitinophagaceae bacterium]